MPGIFAFPGGKLDAEDRRTSGFPEAFPALPRHIDKETRRRQAALIRACLRELHEETGLLLGEPCRREHRADPITGVWRRYETANLAPAFASLRLIARAITPAISHRRFHNRFFAANGHHAFGEISGSGELEEIAWVPVTEARALPMAEIGTLALEEALAHRLSAAGREAALFRWVGRDMVPRFTRQDPPNASRLWR
jgi:8-oxo-dGTP pyrophosphatase MutT (NUDIX family)